MYIHKKIKNFTNTFKFYHRETYLLVQAPVLNLPWRDELTEFNRDPFYLLMLSCIVDVVILKLTKNSFSPENLKKIKQISNIFYRTILVIEHKNDNESFGTLNELLRSINLNVKIEYVKTFNDFLHGNNITSVLEKYGFVHFETEIDSDFIIQRLINNAKLRIKWDLQYIDKTITLKNGRCMEVVPLSCILDSYTQNTADIEYTFDGNHIIIETHSINLKSKIIQDSALIIEGEFISPVPVTNCLYSTIRFGIPFRTVIPLKQPYKSVEIDTSSHEILLILSLT